jgi:hypothetical protein
VKYRLERGKYDLFKGYLRQVLNMCQLLVLQKPGDATRVSFEGTSTLLRLELHDISLFFPPVTRTRMKKSYLPLLFILVLMTQQLIAQDIQPLYPDKIPNSKSASNEETSVVENGIVIVRKVSVPTLQYFPAPAKIATGTAVIIFPGGGYSINAMSHE